MEIKIIRGKEYLYGHAYQSDPKWNEDLGGEPDLVRCKILEPLDKFDSASQISATKFDSHEEMLGKTNYYCKEGGKLLLDVFFDNFIELIK